MIVNALAGKPLPVYGDGQQIRDWLYVKDHCSAIRRVLAAGKLGDVYNVGGWNEKPNIEIVHTISVPCSMNCVRVPTASATAPRSATSPTGPDMTAVTRSTPANCSVNWAGNLPRRSKRGSGRLCSGIWKITLGSITLRVALIVHGLRNSTHENFVIRKRWSGWA